jgi:hypothetical protein
LPFWSADVTINDQNNLLFVSLLILFTTAFSGYLASVGHLSLSGRSVPEVRTGERLKESDNFYRPMAAALQMYLIRVYNGKLTAVFISLRLI